MTKTKFGTAEVYVWLLQLKHGTVDLRVNNEALAEAAIEYLKIAQPGLNEAIKVALKDDKDKAQA